MKSRTSSSEWHLFWKDVARFSPLWGAYLLCLLLGTLLLTDGNIENFYAQNVAGLPVVMGVINFGYALLVAQVLYGDLYNTRMCNALHALPVRRESWFRIHLTAGLLFSLVPTAIMTGLSIVIMVTMSSMVNGWQLALYVFLAINLQYLFFFGLATLCAYCTGSRVGLATVYAIVNVLSYLAYFLIATVYVPMFHGVNASAEIFSLLSPVIAITNGHYIETDYHRESVGFAADGSENFHHYYTFELSGEWTYLFVIAAVGIVLLLLARWMYRRRRLETAGDFLATRKLEPVFMVLFSLTAGAVFQFCQDAILYTIETPPVFLFIGVAVGWFVGRMLLERQIRVFRRGKNWLGMAAMLAAAALSLYVNSLDPFGIEDWVPRAEDVQEAQLSVGYRGDVTLDSPEEFADLIRLHEQALSYKLTAEEVDAEFKSSLETRETTTGYGETVTTQVSVRDYRRAIEVSLVYQLKNGWTMSRQYWIWVDSEEGALAGKYASSVEGIFGIYKDIQTPEELLEYARQPRYIGINSIFLPREQATPETVRSLLEAVIADCEAGTLVQRSDYHTGKIFQDGERYTQHINIDISYANESLYFDVYADSENCMAWLESMGVLDQLEEQFYDLDW